ncbi:hypothetical protein LZ32DRAFT_672495 [Colletotrichum eremochloae]|nr:hypothetical protein LZ32DRAFT_672495 [Colletotrichum eremochloae]
MATPPPAIHPLSTAVPHPFSDDEFADSQSELSSALSNPAAQSELWDETEEILRWDNPSPALKKACMILRVFRQLLPSHGQTALMVDIKLCGRNQRKLRNFGTYLVNTILKPMKLSSNARSAGSTPASPSRGAVNAITRQEQLKAECLRRDGFRCAYSQNPDRQSARARLIDVPAGTPASTTNLSHILPLVLRELDGAVQRERDAVAMVWHGLYRYFPQIKDKIGSGSLNQHENLITFAITIRSEFDDLRLAFEPVTSQVSHLSSQTSIPCLF